MGLLDGLFGLVGTSLNAQYNRELAEENNANAAAREARARKENYYYNEQAAENAYQRQINYYQNFLSPQAKMEQLKETGLSPSLAAGGQLAGASGISAPQGAGASGVAPTTFGIPPIDIVAAMKAMAETKLINAQTDTINGKNERGEAEINEIWARAGAAKAVAAKTQAETIGQEIQNDINAATTEDQIETIQAKCEQQNALAQQAIEDAKIKGLQFQYDQDTYEARVNEKLIEAEMMVKEYLLKCEEIKNVAADTKVKEAQKKLIQTQTTELIQKTKGEYFDQKIYEKSVEAQKKFWENSINATMSQIQTIKDNNVRSTVTSMLTTALVSASMLFLKATPAGRAAAVAPAIGMNNLFGINGMY